MDSIDMGRKRKVNVGHLAHASRAAQQSGAASEDFRISIDKILSDFISHPLMDFYQFPTILNKEMRAYVHHKCLKLGIVSKSTGKEPNRQMGIYKKKVARQIEYFPVNLSPNTITLLDKFKSLYPNNNTARNQFKKMKVQNIRVNDCVGRLFMGSLLPVQPPKDNPLIEFRKNLPIFASKDYILDEIENHSVTIISAETGSGKTTQVPQFILDNAAVNNKLVKIICTQPRRLATISISDRVASERGEKIGESVGYQIKLESKIGQRTSLIYCTNGVLLRTLMGGNECFQNVTHIIVDEIHERDKFTDFLLICLRENVKIYPHLKVILMSATMDMELFVNYFDNVPVKVINVDGRGFEITSWFLDDIMLKIGYENDAMRKMREAREKNGSRIASDTVIPNFAVGDVSDLTADMTVEMDEAINACFEDGSEADFTHLMQLLLEQSGGVNYQDSDEGKTPLMAAAKHGNLAILEQLLNMNADPFIASTCGLTASGWAQKFENHNIVNILSMYNNSVNEHPTQEVVQVLKDYDRTISDDSLVDHDLIVCMTTYIHNSMDKSGAILIFLPGYDDIMACNEAIMNSNIPQRDYKIHMLHSSMQMGSQHQVFKRSPDKRKIILATNIAETSITIDDVRYVIDSGKAKEKTYDLISGISSLKTQWISMASAKQRAGRAGRTQNGYCFHLYSHNRYESFSINKIPEILRVPLHELCLQTKMLAPVSESIESFIQKAIDPPLSIAVEASIATLKNLGALDKQENLTVLGNHLVHLSLDPNLGKMLIYSVIFKCLDPVLTIVACMAHKDPFNIPARGNLKNIAQERRQSLSENSLSDQMGLLRVFQLWQEAKIQNKVYKVCNDLFISAATMETIMQTRAHLLSQLRAAGFVLSNPKENIADLNSYSSCWPVVKACLAAGFYPNVAFYSNNKLQTRIEKNVAISGHSAVRHADNDITLPSSLAHNCWIVYEELNKMQTRCIIRSASVITPFTIAIVCGLESEMTESGFILDEWFQFNFDGQDITHLRSEIDNLVEKRITNPRNRFVQEDSKLLDLLVNMLASEDQKYALPSAPGIGERPKLLHSRPGSSDILNQTSNQINNQASTSGRPWSNYRQLKYSQMEEHNWRNTNKKFLDTNCERFNNTLPHNAKFFIIRPPELRHIQTGMQSSVWRFAVNTERVVSEVFDEGYAVILIFTSRGSNQFYGVAKLLASARNQSHRLLPIEWITNNSVPYYEVKNIIHPRLAAGEDGLQLEYNIGQRLCERIINNQVSISHHNHRGRGGGGCFYYRNNTR